MRYSYDFDNSNEVVFLVIYEQSIVITPILNVDGCTLIMFFL